MLKEVLKSIILSQQEWIVPDEREIQREQLDRYSILPPFTYIITGVRRSGKSTLLNQIMRLHSSNNYFNFEDSRTAGFELADFIIIEELFLELFGNNSMLFFDEIQNVAEWERYIRAAMDKKKTVVITGSNAKLLSKELGTKLTGRHLDYEVYPFSFEEFLLYFNLTASKDSFLSFLTKGGFPGFLNIGKAEMLSALVLDILIRDIFARYNLKNFDVYRKIVQYLLSNTGKEVSFNNMKNTFEIGSANSEMDFMNYLMEKIIIQQFKFPGRLEQRMKKEKWKGCWVL